MKCYVVGGCVRDVLLGLQPKDIDYVWVGATENDMLLMGFKKIEAQSFPVFLDKQGNEHALARTERKVGDGYHGFEVDFNPSVTLADDMYRRDLTMNALAVPVDMWSTFQSTGDVSLVIDLFGGIRDLENSTLYHVSNHFRDDPVRFLRICRFAARYGFAIHPSTSTLMKEMQENGELKHLTPERVWLEVEKSLGELRPMRFFREVAFHHALADVFPALAMLESQQFNEITTGKIASYVSKFDTKQARLAYMLKHVDRSIITHFCDDLKCPSSYKESALLVFDFYKEVVESAADQFDFDLLKRVLGSHNCLRDEKKALPLAWTLSMDDQNTLSAYVYHFMKAINSVKFEDIPQAEQQLLVGKQIGVRIEELQREKVQELRRIMNID